MSTRTTASVRAPLSRCLAALAALAGCVALHAPAARADGDPASDVLLVEPAFVPGDAGIPETERVRLTAVLREAKSAGFPVRVALIGSSYDLGSVYVLWRKPRSYARFLGTELSIGYRGRVLVVMPNGFGLYHHGHPVRAELSSLRGLRVGPGGPGLAAAATTATQRLAAKAGHRLRVPAAVARSPATTSGGHGLRTWAVLGAGLAVIAGAWALSLHLRPLRRRRAPPSDGEFSGRS